MVVKWRLSGGGGGGGVAVAVAHELKVSYFSVYLLFFLAIASKGHALTVSILRCILIAAVPQVLVIFWHDFG